MKTHNAQEEELFLDPTILPIPRSSHAYTSLGS